MCCLDVFYSYRSANAPFECTKYPSAIKLKPSFFRKMSGLREWKGKNVSVVLIFKNQFSIAKMIYSCFSLLGCNLDTQLPQKRLVTI